MLRWLASSAAVLAAAIASRAQPVFYKDVLPILQKHCQQCHRPGEIAPMPFLTYAGTRPWAKAIRTEVVMRKMPPWFADPCCGHFANDRSLSSADLHTLAEWADTGAKEGDPKDAPPPRHWVQGWNVGEPDQVFEMPKAFPIPAKGAVQYQYLILPTHFTEDKWVQEVEVRPSDPATVHHAVVYIREPGSKWLQGQPTGMDFSVPLSKGFTTSDILMVYTPGNSYDGWAPGIAKRIPAGSDLVLQMHYTPYGKATEDRTRIGLIFAKQRPRQEVLSLQMSNDTFVIPPGDPDYRVQVWGTLPNDALLISLFPHMHLRGKDFAFLLPGPHGQVETLLKVSHYNFHWQINYKLAQPRLLKAGTRLLWVAHFDNSANNPLNPDPTAEVRYGEQSWDEMMIGFFDVVVDAGIDKVKFFQRKK